MKKMTAALATAVTLLGLSSQASAVPIQITGSDLEVAGLGVGDYTYSSYAGVFDLAEGEYLDFKFGHVDVLDQEDGCWFLVSYDCASGVGVLALTIELSSPILDGIFGNLALFGITSQGNEGQVRIEWGGPTYFSYSYGGFSGGLLSLHMEDLGGGLFDWEYFDGGIDLWGRISNIQAPGSSGDWSPSPPVAVSEPGILLLLGSGLLAAAALRRRSAPRA